MGTISPSDVHVADLLEDQGAVDRRLHPRIRVASFLGIAKELYEPIHARQPPIAGANLI